MRLFLSLVSAACCLFLASFFHDTSHAAATIAIVNLDGAGEGFSDPTPVAPVGGNVGATLGDQRLIALQRAVDIWSNLISSPVVIRVGANFDPLTCTANGGVLGSAGPATLHRNFPGAPVTNTWYVQALANSLFGGDLDPSTNDLTARFNSNIGLPGCLESSGWYYGLDASPPPGQIDFVTVLLHEIGHGLGFLSVVNLTSGAKFFGFDDAYMRHLEDHTTGKSYPQMTNAERITASTNTGNLHWTGPNVIAAGGALGAGRHPSGHVQMYAPNPQESGSSVSHFDTALSPEELMEPFYTMPIHDPGLARDLLVDLGWNTSALADQTPPARITDLKAVESTQTSIVLRWTAPGDDGEVGAASVYDLRYSDTRLSEANWDAATQLGGLPAPLPSGSVQNATVSGLLCNRVYYFALKAADEENNFSPLSNVAAGRTARCNRLRIQPTRLAMGEVGVPYDSGQVDIAGGAAPYQVDVDAATLPPGVSYNAQAFSGTPTEAKNWRVLATITDAVGSLARARFSLRVAPPVTVVTTGLRAGRVNARYAAQLRARFGQPSYTWSLAAGSPPLPGTLALDPARGRISGIVNNPVTVDVEFQVVDALGGTATRSLTLTFN